MPLQADHRIDKPRRERRQDQPHHGQIQKAHHVDPRDVADIALRIVEPIDVEKIQPQQPEEDQKLRPLHRIAAQQLPVLREQQLQRPWETEATAPPTSAIGQPEPHRRAAASAGKRSSHSSCETSASPPTPSARAGTAHWKSTAPGTTRSCAIGKSATSSVYTTVGSRAASSKPLVSQVLGSHSCCVKRNRCSVSWNHSRAEQPRLRAADRPPNRAAPPRPPARSPRRRR